MSRIPRRTFLKQSIFAATTAGISAKSYRSITAAEPPSERVRVGMIGVGNQGGPKNNLKHFLRNVVTLCDLDQKYLGEAEAFMAKEANLEVTKTDDYRRVLDSKDVDAVVVTVPDHWHALMTVEACQAGKDVYCEKPLSLTISEGRTMVDAARKHQRIVQTGSMQRSGEEFKIAVEMVQKGMIGAIKFVNVTLPGPNWISRAEHPVPDSDPPAGFDYNRWLGPAPLKPYNKNHVHYLFRFYWDYSGGQVTNFGAHHLDIAQWGLGMDDSGPVSIQGTGTYHPRGWYETPESAQITYTYANDIVMTLRQNLSTNSRRQGTEFVGDKGKLLVYRGGILVTPDELLKTVDIDKIAASRMNPKHIQNFLECVKTRQTPVADVAIGHRSATVCHLGNIAIRTKRKLQWDPQTETIVGDPEASQWLSREYRKPWVLT